MSISKRPTIFPRSRMMFVLFMLAVLLTTVTASAQPSLSRLSNYNLGVKAYQQGEFRQAFDAWSLGAYEGDIEAQYNLGVLYLEGRGVERNSEQARDWFLKAARTQHLEALYNLGHMAMSGIGMKKDRDAALDWWRQAAQGGYAQAQFNYGRALYLGVGVGSEQDKEAGMEMVRAAAIQDDARAKKFLKQYAIPADHEIAKIDEQVEATTQEVIVEAPITRVEISNEQTKEAPLDQILPEVSEYQPGRVKLNIIRDQVQVRKDYFSRTENQPVAVYALPDLSNRLDILKPKTLVKVLRVEADTLKIEVITALSVWVKQDGLKRYKGSATAARGGLPMYQSPAKVALGELPENIALRVLGQQGEWLNLSMPQQIYGWINARSLAYSGESKQQLRAQWASQLRLLKGLPDQPEVAVDKVSHAVTAQVQHIVSEQIVSEQIVEKQVIAEPVIEAQASVVQAKPVDSIAPAMNDNLWLFTQAQGAYAVHVFTLLDQAKATKVAAEPLLRGKAKLYTTKVQQQTWSFLLLGPYANVELAKVARGRLPAYLKKGARIRSIKLIAENRCKKRFQLHESEALGLDAFCLE